MSVLTQVTDVYPGNSSTEKSAFTSKTPVPKAPNGTELPAFPILATVPTDIIKKVINASLSLNNVLQPLHGSITGVSPVEAALTALLEKPTAVNPTLLAPMAKVGTPVSFNVLVPREPDGTARNVLSVLEDKSGT